MARVLVIEDHPDNRELVRYLLIAHGHEVIEAATGKVGLSSAKAGQPDVVLCDIQLPDIGGEEIVRRLRADPATAHLLVIAVTSFAMVGDRERLMASGFNGYIAKPIDPATFVPSIEQILEARDGHAVATVRPRAVRAGASSVPPQATPPERRRDSAGDVREGPGRRTRILAVDDNEPNRSFLQDLLGDAGYEVESCASASAALRAIATARPDLVVSDVHMRPTDGFALFRLVRDNPETSDLRFIFLSSTMQASAEIQRGVAMGASGFIVRPAAPQLILDEVARVLRGG